MDSTLESKEKIVALVDELTDAKAEDSVLIDVKGVCDWTDYIAFVTGVSRIHMKGLSERALNFAKKEQWALLSPKPSANEDSWILVDCGEVVINIMSSEGREYYNLEEIYSKGEVIPVKK